MFLRYTVPAPLERGWGRRASQHKNAPVKLSVGVSYGVKLIDLGNVLEFCHVAASQMVWGSVPAMSACDCHFVGLVTRDPFWKREVVTVI